jgi:hypothetical protein
MTISKKDQAASELRRIPVEYLEKIGQVRDSPPLPPLANPFSGSDDPADVFAVNEMDFYEDKP